MEYCSNLLKELMEVEFACVELNLYLDTHPEDRQALCSYGKLCQRFQELKEAYEEQVGPLFNFGLSKPRGDSWQWIDSPWPWEINY